MRGADGMATGGSGGLDEALAPGEGGSGGSLVGVDTHQGCQE